MRKVQKDRYNTALAVQSYLKENADLYAGNAPMEDAVALLDTKIAQLDRLSRQQKIKSTGLTMDKKEIRKGLENKAFAISSGLSVYALVKEDRLLYKGCRYTRSDLIHLKDMRLASECQQLFETAEELAEELLPYKITPEMIAEFKATKDHFNAMRDEPMYLIEDKAKATKEIQVLLPEIMDVIRLRLDALMVLLLPTQPHFVSVFKNIRKINKTGVRKRNLTVIVKDFDTGKPLAQAALVTDKKIKRKSGPRGMSFIQHLPEGRHQLGVSLAGYVSESLKFTVVHTLATKVEVLLRKTPVVAQTFARNGVVIARSEAISRPWAGHM